MNTAGGNCEHAALAIRNPTPQTPPQR